VTGVRIRIIYVLNRFITVSSLTYSRKTCNRQSKGRGRITA